MLGVAFGAVGAGLAVGVFLLSRRAAASTSRAALPTGLPPTPEFRPLDNDQRRLTLPLIPFDERDVEAAARMLASENPQGSLELHVEQSYTQVRQAIRRGESLFQQITRGSGYGEQGERAAGGGLRPVSTAKPATAALLERARDILRGKYASKWPSATKYFEPLVEDRAFAVAERARKKQAENEPLSANEQRLLKYRDNADSIRRRWSRDGMPLGTIDGVEFWT